MKWHIYSSGHKHAAKVCEALGQGTGFPVTVPWPLQEGGVAMYGFLRGLLPTLIAAQQTKRPWAYVDRGYFRATYGDDYSGYFRLTRNAYQHHGRGDGDSLRWKNLCMRINPWRKGGHILVCPPGDIFTRAIGGFNASAWLANTMGVLQCATDRPIKIRHKPVPGQGVPLEVDLQDCHALVTYMSNTAVEAVLAGVPVFCTGQCAASSMGKSSLREIEKPYYPDDRERWAAVLANNQWTLPELKRGIANGVFHA